MINPLFPMYLTAPWKMTYMKQKKDPHQCIFCAIIKRNPGIKSWEVYRDKLIMVLLNRFPYNPGHLLIVPLEHYEEFEKLPLQLIHHLTTILQRCIKLLKHTHKPNAFNIGLNIGNVAGGSIDHLHWHIVPRYSGDLNFMEILSTRIMIETLEQTFDKLCSFIYMLSSD
jgi:diadenosine tetraphosphate (Ap4A) HIT family hydrolase